MGFLGIEDVKEAGEKARKEKLRKSKKKNSRRKSKQKNVEKRSMKEDVNAWEKNNKDALKGTS